MLKWLVAAVLVQAAQARNATLVFGLGLPKTGTRSLRTSKNSPFYATEKSGRRLYNDYPFYAIGPQLAQAHS